MAALVPASTFVQLQLEEPLLAELLDELDPPVAAAAPPEVIAEPDVETSHHLAPNASLPWPVVVPLLGATRALDRAQLRRLDRARANRLALGRQRRPCLGAGARAARHALR